MQEERLKNLLERSKNILIVPAYPNEPESLNASRLLFKILRNIGKNATLALDNQISAGGLETKKICLTINSFDRHVKQIYYEKNKKTINIFVDFLGHDIAPDDINLKNLGVEKDLIFDLIITLGVPNLASLDDFLEENFKLFYEKPIINIDNTSNNEGYGQINLISLETPLDIIVRENFNFDSIETEIRPVSSNQTTETTTEFSGVEKPLNPPEISLIKNIGEKNFG